MKTKLLKKVRKEYTIIKISSYSNVANSTWKGYCKDMGFPFFYVKDLLDDWGFRNRGFREYKAATSYLLKVIMVDYAGKRKRITKAKEEKVWHV